MKLGEVIQLHADKVVGTAGAHEALSSLTLDNMCRVDNEELAALQVEDKVSEHMSQWKGVSDDFEDESVDCSSTFIPPTSILSVNTTSAMKSSGVNVGGVSGMNTRVVTTNAMTAEGADDSVVESEISMMTMSTPLPRMIPPSPLQPPARPPPNTSTYMSTSSCGTSSSVMKNDAVNDVDDDSNVDDDVSDIEEEDIHNKTSEPLNKSESEDEDEQVASLLKHLSLKREKDEKDGKKESVLINLSAKSTLNDIPSDSKAVDKDDTDKQSKSSVQMKASLLAEKLTSRPPPPKVSSLFSLSSTVGDTITSIEQLQSPNTSLLMSNKSQEKGIQGYIQPKDTDEGDENDKNGNRLPTYESAAMMLQRCAKEKEKVEMELKDRLCYDFSKMLAMQMEKSRLTLAALFRLVDNSGDGFLDFEEVTALVRKGLRIHYSQISNSDLKLIFKVTKRELV